MSRNYKLSRRVLDSAHTAAVAEACSVVGAIAVAADTGVGEQTVRRSVHGVPMNGPTALALTHYASRWIDTAQDSLSSRHRSLYCAGIISHAVAQRAGEP